MATTTLQRFILGLTLLSSAAPFASAAPRHTGIRGQAFVYISYGAPVQVEPGIWIGIPGVQYPVATAFTVFSANNGREVARVATDAAGAFAVSLAPGRYVLAPDTLTLPVGCSTSTKPIEVTVRAREIGTANIFYFRHGPCVIRADP